MVITKFTQYHGLWFNHCILCGAIGHNQRACPSKGLEGSATGVNPPLMSARGGKMYAKGGKTSSVVTGSDVRLRGGVYIRGDSPSKPASNKSRGLRTFNGKVVTSRGRGDGSKSKMYPGGIRSIGYGVSWDLIDGETMLGNSMGLPRAAWPAGITPEDVRIHAQ
ncbi:hypothetical protein Tco_1540355 [Tanacetum coccineum]